MATVRGPLFSVSASGSFRGIVFATSGTRTVVAGERQKLPGRTPAQQAQAARFQTALTAWNGLDASAKQSWRTAATGTGNSGYQLYISEYIGQNIAPPSQPILP